MRYRDKELQREVERVTKRDRERVTKRGRKGYKER